MNLGKQRGFSLVELMVAMVVALILIAGILQILLGNRQSFDVQKTMAGLQDNMRLASFVMDNTLAQAGYRDRGVLDAPDSALFPEKSDGTGHGLAIARGAFVAGHDGGGDADDALRVRLRAAQDSRDCLGGDYEPADRVDFALYVEHDPQTDTDVLYCAVYGGNTQPLVNNVVRFKVRYGLDTDDDGSVDRYLTPDDDKSLGDTQARQVRSLRLQLLLASDPGVKIAPSALKQTFLFADNSQVETDKLDIADPGQRAYVLLDKTVALRNALP